MTKQELITLIRKVAAHYGEEVTCEMLDFDGNEWLKGTMEIDSHFIHEVEKQQIRNIKFKNA